MLRRSSNWILIPVCIPLLICCSDQISRKSQVFVETFRSEGLSDDQVIQKAIDEAGEGGSIIFEASREYLLRNGLIVKKFQTLIGNNATLKRADQTYSHLRLPAPAADSSLLLDSVPPGWKRGDLLQVFIDEKCPHSTSFADEHILPNMITGMDSTRIRLSTPVGPSIDGSIPTWPKGAVVRKVFTLLRGDSINFQSCPFTVSNINFNGNKAANNLNFYWNVNSTIFTRGLGARVENCRFYEIPNENIVGQGIYVENCQAANLNGSFVHLSGVDTIRYFRQKSSIITGNTVDGVCLMNTAITGHSEGAITSSYNGGFATIVNNRIYNCREAAFGAIGSPVDIADGGNSELIISNNIFRNCSKIVYRVTYAEDSTKLSRDIFLNGNIFSNCGYNDWRPFTKDPKHYPRIRIGVNDVTNNTVWLY